MNSGLHQGCVDRDNLFAQPFFNEGVGSREGKDKGEGKDKEEISPLSPLSPLSSPFPLGLYSLLPLFQLK